MSKGIPTPIPDCLPRDGPGKPTLCTPAIIAAVESRLRRAGYPTVVLEALGISGTCHNRWLKLAEEDDNKILDTPTQYQRYRQAVQRAQAERELSLAETVANAAEAGPQYWPAGMTYLERRHPDRWGRRDESRQVSAGPVQIQVVFASRPDRSSAIEVIEVASLPPAALEIAPTPPPTAP